LQTVLELEQRRLSQAVVTTNTIATEVARIRTETAGRLGDQRMMATCCSARIDLSRASSHVDLPRIGDGDVPRVSRSILCAGQRDG
jgi:hypothetical protein